jgi:hypothetical protein
MNDFCAFILTNGRPDRVYTYKTLKKCGYSGRIILLVDNLDKTKDEYVRIYGKEVVIFDKEEIAKTFDQGDNFNDMRAIIYARNASFKVAKDLGIKWFIQLDDDYQRFEHRFTSDLDYFPPTRLVRNLDGVFASMRKFMESTNCSSIAMAQGGDFIGGRKSPMASSVKLKRKAMNSFLCTTEREFKFIGRVNEDVNTYTRQASTGLLLFTTNQVSLVQKATQSNKGGMTELYLDSGTYLKSFYSVMFHPSGVKVSVMHANHKRIHHLIQWKHTTPMILRESLRK